MTLKDKDSAEQTRVRLQALLVKIKLCSKAKAEQFVMVANTSEFYIVGINSLLLHSYCIQKDKFKNYGESLRELVERMCNTANLSIEDTDFLLRALDS